MAIHEPEHKNIKPTPLDVVDHTVPAWPSVIHAIGAAVRMTTNVQTSVPDCERANAIGVPGSVSATPAFRSTRQCIT